MKQCSKCGRVLHLARFYEANGMRDGRRGDCIDCFLAGRRSAYAANPDPHIQRARRWKAANPERHKAIQAKERAKPAMKRYMREYHLRETFGISVADYELMLRKQGGTCALCRRPPAKGKVLHVDHDPLSGGIRALLCFKCNGGLGQFNEDWDLLEKAAEYLLHHRVRARALALKEA